MLFACGEDNITHSSKVLEKETISGTITFSVDTICCLDVSVVKYSYEGDSIESIEILSTVKTDSDGNYLFNNIIPEQENLFIQITSNTINVNNITASDSTPDGDDFEDGSIKGVIGVYLEIDEKDDGNDFNISTQQSCSTNIVKGKVVSDNGTDMTPIPHQPMAIYVRDENGYPADLLSSTITDMNGEYEFFLTPIVYDAVIVLDEEFSPIPEIISISAVDESPDGDPSMGSEQNFLPVDLDSCEVDEDNNFYILPAISNSMVSISGFVLLDEDKNGVGEAPLSGKRIELYHRNSDNVPQTPQVGVTHSESDGTFAFKNIDPGEYVLYFIGNGNHQLNNSFDKDQEPGEPSGPELIFIPVDIPEEGYVDSLNYYLMNSISTGCNAKPSIVEYWALCDTSIICEYDEWPIVCVDENGDLITSAGGLYSLEWKDLLTGESVTGDWTYTKLHHPVELLVSYPDGCQYGVYYHRECPQDLTGEFSMTLLRSGWQPDYNYSKGEILWDFDPFAKKVTITHNITSPISTNLIDEGIYDYEILLEDEEYNLILTDNISSMEMDVGVISHMNNEIIIDDNLAADGVQRTFEK